MAAQKGKDILLKIGDGASPEVFTTVAGVRARTLSFNAKSVEVTDSDSPGRWRELLDGAGVRQCAVSGSGVFRDAQADALIRQSFFDQSARSWQLVIPGFGVVAGPFLVAALEYAGQFDGEATFALTLASAGALVFTPAAS
jgi:TP901-1 family phage major tail protein